MRICALGLRGMPGVMGGVESHCEQLYPRIAAANVDADITVMGRAPYLPRRRQAFGGVAVVPLPSLRSRSLEAISNALAAVVYARLKFAPDLVHIHAVGPALVTPLARLLGLRTIVTHHGQDYAREKWGWSARLMLRLGERSAMRSADRVIAVSPSLAKELCTKFPQHAHKVRFIANGASRPGVAAAGDAEADALYEDHQISPQSFILAVGRLVPEKGFHDLIAALQTSPQCPPLVIAGKADHEDGYARELLAQGGDRVRFVGFQPHAVLRRLYQDAALFVLPSHHEGLPIAALEAMASATPMLLSDIAANRDLGLPEDNYFPVGDRPALSVALSKPARIYGAYDPYLVQNFDWDKIAAQTMSTYREVATTGRRAATSKIPAAVLGKARHPRPF